MRRPPAFLVALLVVAAMTTPVAGWSTGPPHQTAWSTSDDPAQMTYVNNTTNHLSIPADVVATSEFNSTGIDVGASVAAGSRQLHQQHEGRTFKRRFNQLNSDFERTQLIRETLSDIETREQVLDRRFDRQLDRYASGAISATEFARTRALVDAEARQLSATLARIDSVQRISPQYTISSGLETRLVNSLGEVQTHMGPISRMFVASFSGSEQRPVYIQASEDGYMLATVMDGQYVRETHLGNQRDPNTTDQFAASDSGGISAADDRAAELYPWLYDQQQRPSIRGYGTSGIYRFTADHPNGQLTTYLDGGTTNVFHESQFRRLATAEITDTRTTVNGTVRIRLYQSHETGPLRVVISNSETNKPAPATVAIDGRRVGATGDDGILWTIEPRGTYTVNVTTTDGDRVTVPVQ